jgi:hypothetical protein
MNSSRTPFFAPDGRGSTAKLRPVVQNDRSRQSTLTNDPVRHAPSLEAPGEILTSMAGDPRVQSSTSVNIQIAFPVLTQSLTKSIDQR